MKNSNPSRRQSKVAHLINIALDEILKNSRGLDLFLIENKITITKIDISPDLKMARCYFVPFSRDISAEKVTCALEKSMAQIRYQLAGKINLRYAPDLKFFYDAGYENISNVMNLIKKI